MDEERERGEGIHPSFIHKCLSTIRLLYHHHHHRPASSAFVPLPIPPECIAINKHFRFPAYVPPIIPSSFPLSIHREGKWNNNVSPMSSEYSARARGRSAGNIVKRSRSTSAAAVAAAAAVGCIRPRSLSGEVERDINDINALEREGGREGGHCLHAGPACQGRGGNWPHWHNFHSVPPSAHWSAKGQGSLPPSFNERGMQRFGRKMRLIVRTTHSLTQGGQK